MTPLLQKAIDTLSKLPEEDQDRFADWLLEEIASDKKWEEWFPTKSPDELPPQADGSQAENEQVEESSAPSRRKYTLDELLSGVTEDNLHGETIW